MTTPIRIRVGDLIVEGELFDTPCAQRITEFLPLEGIPQQWGDEFYFPIPVAEPLDATATKVVQIGEIGYWPPGRALAIFFGRTPYSIGEAPVPASAVNVVGRVTEDARMLRRVTDLSRIRVERREHFGQQK
jgi:hypothetical protein